MKLSNRITIVIIVAALSVFMLAACGNNGPGAGAGSSGETTEATLPAEDVSSAANQDDHQMQTDPAHSAESGDIGIEKVQSIVLAKVPGATTANIYELERDHDDGRLEYEGSIYYNGYEYDFEVDGATGNILKWEIDD